MADPKAYKRGYSFTNYQADVPDQPLPGPALDVELDNIAEATETLATRVNAGIDVSINQDALEAVAGQIAKIVYTADNMEAIRDVAGIGPNIELAADLFQGAHSNDPSVSYDGDALRIGATYYNTLIGESRVWAGPTVGWVPVAKVSTGGVLQGGTTVADGATEFMIGDYVSIVLSKNGLVLEPGVDYSMASPNVTVPGVVNGDRLTWFAILKGTPTDAAQFVRHAVLTTTGVTTYATSEAGAPLNLSQTNHVLFGGSPFGMLTYGVDYTVANGNLVLDFLPSEGELYHIFSMPRFTNSEAQAILQDFREGVDDRLVDARARADAAQAQADRAMRGALNVKLFGAIGNGTADDTAAFQAAANAVGNGTVIVPPGDWMIHEILCTQGTTFDCTLANGETSANANGTAAGQVRFRYNGAGGPSSFMFRWRAATASQWLFGGGIIGRPVLNGMTTCAYGVLADSTMFQNFVLEERNFTGGAVRLSSDNGVLSAGCRVRLNFTYGSVAAVEGAHGVILIGETNNAGCTQHDIKTHGLVHDGDMVRLIGNCDNNRLVVHGSRGLGVNAGAGNAIAFYEGATVHPRNNTIYDVAGPIYSATGAFGNWLLRSSSEGTKIYGPGQLHYSMVDYVNGKRYATPAFPMFERRELAGTSGFLIGGATAGTVTGVGAGVICAAGANSGALWTIAGGNWTRGKLRRFRVKYSCANASASNTIRFRLNASVAAIGTGFSSDYTASMNAAGAAAGNLSVHEFVVLDASNLDMAEDAVVSFSIERLGTDAADTVTGAVRIHAVEVDFVAFGPENTYTAPVAYPDFRRAGA